MRTKGVVDFHAYVQEGVRGHHYSDKLPEMTVEELLAVNAESIEQSQAEIEPNQERLAIRDAAIQAEIGKRTTDDLAVAALKRPERFKGEHDVARAWLQGSSTARIWSKK